MTPSVFPIETPRLRLEAYTPADLERAHAILGDRATMRLWPDPFSLERTKAWLTTAMLGYDEAGTGRVAVVSKATGETIGDAGIAYVEIDGEMTFDLGVILAPAHHGKGYASEIARALIGVAFGALRLTELKANAPLEDVASRAFLERAGFRYVRTFANQRNSGKASALYAIHAPGARTTPFVKMCGMTSPYEAELAVASGADAIGMIFAPSDRRVTLDDAREIVRALPALTLRVAVFVDAPGEEVRRVCAELGAIPQFSGSESLAYCERNGGDRCLRVIRVAEGADPSDLARRAESGPRIMPFFETLVAGSSGGSGRHFDWSLAAAVAKTRPIGVSGGLTPENVAECVRIARPFAVDVRSGVEAGGRKSFERMQAFVAAALGTRTQTAAFA